MSQVRTFYSLVPGLGCYAGKTQRLPDGTTIDPPFVRFTPMGSAPVNGQKFGYYSTADPEVIDYLENRIAQSTDVISDEEFNRRMTPPEVREKTLEQQNRELVAEKNRLLEQLAAAQKVSAQVQPQLPGRK
jgi:hypothetical protein